MDLNHLIRARAHRILRKTSGYRKVSKEIDIMPSYLGEIPFQENEQVCGVYESLLDERNECIVFTILGIHVFYNGEWVFIKYIHIEDIKTPHKERSVTELIIYLHSGEVIALPIRGGGSDVWGILHFLMRVINDIHKRGIAP